MPIVFSARTHVGRVRQGNEDNFLVDRSMHLYIVCDGMGGHLSGEVASASAVNITREVLQQNRSMLDAYRDNDGTVDEDDVRGVITQAIQTASYRIYERGMANPEQRGMGTTLSLMLLTDRRAFIGHVGDSRIYRLREGRLEQITEDHSLYNAMRASGADIDEVKLAGRLRNAVTRAVGVQDSVEVDTMTVALKPGDRYLLCSDGLSGYWEDDPADLQPLVVGDDLETICDGLIDAANAQGGKDNITAVLIQLPGTEEMAESEAEFAHEEVLRRCPLAQGMTDRDVRTLHRWMKSVEHQAGTRFLQPGDAADSLMVVAAGEVLLTSDAGTTRLVRAGDVIGDVAVAVGGAHSVAMSVPDEGSVVLLVLDRTDLVRMPLHEPVIYARIMQNLSRALATRLDETTDALGDPMWRYGTPYRPTTRPVGRRRHRDSTMELEGKDVVDATPESLAPPPLPGGLTPELFEQGADEGEVGEAVVDTQPLYELGEDERAILEADTPE